MPQAPSTGQLALAVLAAVCFAASGVCLAVPRWRRWVVLCFVVGLLAGVCGLVWHSIARGSGWPLEDNFDALLWLALLVAGLSLYLRGIRTVGRIDWVMTPMVVVLLVGAIVFGAASPHVYTQDVWAWVHRVGVFASSLALTVAAASGAMYLILTRRLQNKHQPVDARFGSLERLERLTLTSVSFGFGLLTIGIITGVIWATNRTTRMGTDWFTQPKVLLAAGAWVSFALVLHSPINPAFKGRRAAMLSIAGFVFLIGTLVVVQGFGGAVHR